MRGLFLGLAAASLAAITLPMSPAGAQGFTGMRGGSSALNHGPGSGNRDGKFRHNRRPDSEVFINDWGYDDWDGGRAWESDSYNDWWHDRTDRSFPRWLQTNQACERIWWSGSGWRC